MTTTKWALDPTHSEIQFKIKHLMISTVTGQFNSFKGTIETENEDFSTARINFTADIDSISTNNEQRDLHLKNGDFFDAENYPRLEFKGTKMEKTGDETFNLQGSLTMRGVSKPVSLDVEFGGNTIDPWGNTRVGFAVTGKIKRTDFGVSFGMLSETGNVMLGEEVKLFANVQFVKQAELQPA
ncbi:MAG: YceI family protein [Ferruginibacter sp.]